MSFKNFFGIFSFIILIISSIIYFSFDTSYEEIEEVNSKAKCIDGSSYKFLLSKGSGNGTSSFYIYFEGGGWCGGDNPLISCYKRKNTPLGSNKFDFIYRYFNKYLSRFLASSKYFNPIFYNWNKIFIKYCDGTIHMGNNLNPIVFNNTKLYTRGEENVKSVFNYLIKNHNFSNAKNVLAVGSSAGGIAVVFYSKYIRSLLTNKTNFRVISDSGFFHHGTYRGINKMDDTMMRMKNSLNISQTETMKQIDKDLDFFNSSNPIKYINKLNNYYPILFITSYYDSAVLKGFINSTCHFGFKVYDSCDENEIKIFEQYAKDVENDFTEIFKNDKNKKITAFINKGFFHVFLLINWSWNDKTYGVNGYSIQEFVTAWYYDLLPKDKRMYESKNVLKRKIDPFWIKTVFLPNF